MGAVDHGHAGHDDKGVRALTLIVAPHPTGSTRSGFSVHFCLPLSRKRPRSGCFLGDVLKVDETAIQVGKLHKSICRGVYCPTDPSCIGRIQFTEEPFSISRRVARDATVKILPIGQRSFNELPALFRWHCLKF